MLSNMERAVFACAVLAMTVMTFAEVTAADDVTSCCTPPQWTGRQITRRISSAFGVTFVTQQRADVWYDATNERQVWNVNETYTYGSPQTYRYLAYHKIGLAYTYRPGTDECNVASISTSFPKRCVAAGSVVVDDDVRLGANDDDEDDDNNGNVTSSAVRLAFPYKIDGIAGAGQLVLTAEDCIPITEFYIAFAYQHFRMTTHEFENIEEEDLDSSDIFTLPDACVGLQLPTIA